MISQIEFQTASRVFLASPSADTLALLTAVAGQMVEGHFNRQLQGWEAITPDTDPRDFQEIRATFDRILTDAEVMQASGAIGYALRIYLAGEELSEPREIVREPRQKGDFSAGKTIVTYWYDATKGQRSEPNLEEAFEAAQTYIVEGSPVRLTDRAGRGTKGTQLVPGIGKVGVTFEVR